MSFYSKLPEVWPWSKGHETGQNIGSEVLPFDDREVIRAEWKIMARQSEEDQAR